MGTKRSLKFWALVGELLDTLTQNQTRLHILYVYKAELKRNGFPERVFFFQERNLELLFLQK